jgi:hypothetical protein
MEHFILDGSIRAKGVLTPVLPEIVDPVLAELKKEGIALEESESAID